ncbi:SDR family oxidoreductase [Catenulispora yoronensis]|uniref:SDR family oxidoreductase n=1 Tax=Catenulispora yoronensis TaxID=450799 RepID=A0ABP5FSJ6_9ACTN
MSKVWFITGTSKGFGREWAEAALERGDRVAGTARDLATLDALAKQYPDTFLPLRLDVTDRDGDFAAVRRAAEHFGRLNVVVNNAGYGHFGTIEELTEAEVRAQLETNLFGALWVTQAALPILREQGSGHIIQVSSIGGVSAFPGIGAYHASKWGLEGFSQALAGEVAPFGIHVTIVEPGGFSTDWAGPSAVRSAELPAYEAFWAADRERRTGMQRGNPSSTSPAILKIVDAEQPPLRVFLGRTPLSTIEADYASRLATWREWQDVAVAAHGED